MCRNTTLKVKTASGIKRFQENKDFSNWIPQLLAVVQSMDSCQPEQAIEPGICEDNDVINEERKKEE